MHIHAECPASWPVDPPHTPGPEDAQLLRQLFTHICTGLDQLLGLRQETGRTGSRAWVPAQPPAFFKASSCLEGSCRHPEMKKQMWAQTLSTRSHFLSFFPYGLSPLLLWPQRSQEATQCACLVTVPSAHPHTLLYPLLTHMFQEWAVIASLSGTPFHRKEVLLEALPWYLAEMSQVSSVPSFGPGSAL